MIAVNTDGFDETEQTVFLDMLTETGKIEQYIQDHFNGYICAAYGCSYVRVNNTRMSFVHKRSIRNQFYSDLITPLQMIWIW